MVQLFVMQFPEHLPAIVLAITENPQIYVNSVISCLAFWTTIYDGLHQIYSENSHQFPFSYSDNITALSHETVNFQCAWSSWLFYSGRKSA